MANNVNITNRGFEYIAQMIAGSGATYGIPSHIGWGTANGYNASSVVMPAAAPQGFPLPGPSTAGTGQWFDVGPYSESTEARVSAGTPVIVSNNVTGSSYATTTFVGTITAGETVAIGESFLTPSATKPPTFTLASSVGTSWASLTVSTGTGTVGQYYQLNNEVIYVGTVVSQVWTISRAQNGSVAGTATTHDGLTMGNIPGAAVTGSGYGDMFAHAGFVALSLNSGDSIQFTWQVNVTS